MGIKKEVAVITTTLSEDDELFYAYQSNIAMAFIDEYDRNEKKYKNRSDIHEIANSASKNFLNMWINQR